MNPENQNQSVKVEVLASKPTHTLVRFLSSKQEIKMAKQYFQKRVDCGWYEIVNQDKPSLLI